MNNFRKINKFTKKNCYFWSDGLIDHFFCDDTDQNAITGNRDSCTQMTEDFFLPQPQELDTFNCYLCQYEATNYRISLNIKLLRFNLPGFFFIVMGT